MNLRIERKGSESLVSYEQVPISFEIHGRVDLTLLEDIGSVETVPCFPRRKDYDEASDQRPTQLALRYDIANWPILMVYEGDTVVGGAILAPPKSGYELPGAQNGSGIMVDLRVHPSMRQRGVGRALISAAISLAHHLGWEEILVETQDTNLAACQFYANMGFSVRSIDREAYGTSLDEAQIIWRFKLGES